jgi:hypothetical protein
MGKGGSAAEATASAEKVACIRASFTAEFPETLFVAPEALAAPIACVRCRKFISTLNV